MEILELKYTITAIKNTMKRLNSTKARIEERLSEL